MLPTPLMLSYFYTCDIVLPVTSAYLPFLPVEVNGIEPVGGVEGEAEGRPVHEGCDDVCLYPETVGVYEHLDAASVVICQRF